MSCYSLVRFVANKTFNRARRHYTSSVQACSELVGHCPCSRFCIQYFLEQHSAGTPTRLGVFLRLARKRNIKIGHVGVLKFEAFLSLRKCSIPNREKLFLVQQKIPFIVDGPLIFASHGQRINGAGLHTHAAKEATGHIHRIGFGIALDRFIRHLCADDVDHPTRARGFTKVATHAFFRAIVVSQ